MFFYDSLLACHCSVDFVRGKDWEIKKRYRVDERELVIPKMQNTLLQIISYQLDFQTVK